MEETTLGVFFDLLKVFGKPSILALAGGESDTLNVGIEFNDALGGFPNASFVESDRTHVAPGLFRINHMPVRSMMSNAGMSLALP